jgi:anaerobic ribonucleoside-triphosphate reductase activating protein
MDTKERKKLRVHRIIPVSEANGPGKRYVIWVQGCSIHCDGCSNTDTWDFEGGEGWDVDDLVKDILSRDNLDGATITGGEPLDQAPAVTELCKKLINHTSIFLTTGYPLKDLIHDFSKGALPWVCGDRILANVDILCTGPFEKDKVCSGEWRGSSNQVITYLSERGRQQSTMPVVLKEFHIDTDGTTIETGFSC